MQAGDQGTKSLGIRLGQGGTPVLSLKKAAPSYLGKLLEGMDPRKAGARSMMVEAGVGKDGRKLWGQKSVAPRPRPRQEKRFESKKEAKEGIDVHGEVGKRKRS